MRIRGSGRRSFNQPRPLSQPVKFNQSPQAKKFYDMGYIFDPPRFMTQLTLTQSHQNRTTSLCHKQRKSSSSPQSQSEMLFKLTLKAPTAILSPAPTIDISLTQNPTAYTIHSNKIWYRSRPTPSKGVTSRHLVPQNKQTVKERILSGQNYITLQPQPPILQTIPFRPSTPPKRENRTARSSPTPNELSRLTWRKQNKDKSVRLQRSESRNCRPWSPQHDPLGEYFTSHQHDEDS